MAISESLRQSIEESLPEIDPTLELYWTVRHSYIGGFHNYITKTGDTHLLSIYTTKLAAEIWGGKPNTYSTWDGKPAESDTLHNLLALAYKLGFTGLVLINEQGEDVREFG